MKKLIKSIVFAIISIVAVTLLCLLVGNGVISLRASAILLTLIVFVVSASPIKDCDENTVKKIMLKHSGKRIVLAIGSAIISLLLFVVAVVPNYLIDGYTQEVVDFCGDSKLNIINDLSNDIREPFLLDACLVKASDMMTDYAAGELEEIPEFPVSSTTDYIQLSESCKNLNTMLNDFEKEIIANNGDSELNNIVLLKYLDIVMRQYVDEDEFMFMTNILYVLVYCILVFSLSYILRYAIESVYLSKCIKDSESRSDSDRDV